MDAIQTRFLGPTNHKGARIRAYSHKLRGVIVSYGYGGNESEHDAAARAFITHMGWFGVWVRGGSADGRGHTYTCAAAHHEGKTSHKKCEAIFQAIGDLSIYVTP